MVHWPFGIMLQQVINNERCCVQLISDCSQMPHESCRQEHHGWADLSFGIWHTTFTFHMHAGDKFHSVGQNAHHYYRHGCMIRLEMIDNHISRQVFLYLVANMGQRKNYCIPMRNPIADLGILPSNAHYWVIEPLWWVKAAADHFRWNEFRWHESSILIGSILFKG